MQKFRIVYELTYEDPEPVTVEGVRAIADSAEDDLSDAMWSGPLALRGAGRVVLVHVEPADG